MNRFDDRRVLVTGAGSGIGYEIASQFLREGAKVFAADLSPETCPAGVTPLRLDVADERGFQETIADVLAVTGRLDVLCNNAGTGSTSDPISCTVEEWDHVFAVNARGVFIGTKYALPPHVESRQWRDREHGIGRRPGRVEGSSGLLREQRRRHRVYETSGGSIRGDGGAL